MIFELVVDESSDRFAALRIARERYNVENTNEAGFAAAKSDQEFVQQMFDRQLDAYAKRYVREPQTMADALNRITDLEAQKQALSAQVKTLSAAAPVARATP